MRATAFPPRQARSRATLDRLLTATTRVVEARGLEGTTVAAIAREADVAPTVIYRRFRDKDALLEGVFTHMMDAQETALAQLSGAPLMRGVGLEEFVQRTVRAQVVAYRRIGRFLNAARQFAVTRGSAAFKNRVERFEVLGFRHAIGMVLERRNEIAHKTPEAAVAVGLLAVVGAIRENSNWPAGPWRELFPSDDALAAHLSGIYLAYLRSAT